MRAAVEAATVPEGIKIKFRLPKENSRKENFVEISVVPTSPFKVSFSVYQCLLVQWCMTACFLGRV